MSLPGGAGAFERTLIDVEGYLVHPAYRMGWVSRANFSPPVRFNANPYLDTAAYARRPFRWVLEWLWPCARDRRLDKAERWSDGWLAANRHRHARLRAEIRSGVDNAGVDRAYDRGQAFLDRMAREERSSER